MNALTIKDPADLLSFIGHTLGFWPEQSLVCITLDKDKVGATLRIDLPKQPGLEIHFAQTVAAYLTTDERATGIVFVLYTTEGPEPGQARPHRATIAALTGVLAGEGITIRDGIYVTDTSYSPYDTRPGENIAIPLNTTEYSRVNAEFIYRGSTIAHTNQVTLPAATHKAEDATAVGRYMKAITNRPPAAAIEDAHRLWTGMLSSSDYPTDQDILRLVAYFQFPHIRDQLMADIPSIDEPPEHVLFAQTDSTPNWSRIEWAQQLLTHAYTKTSPQHAAPILTTIGYINCWEGRGSKHTNTSNSPSTPTPATDSHASPTTCSAPASSQAGTTSTCPDVGPQGSGMLSPGVAGPIASRHQGGDRHRRRSSAALHLLDLFCDLLEGTLS